MVNVPYRSCKKSRLTVVGAMDFREGRVLCIVIDGNKSSKLEETFIFPKIYPRRYPKSVSDPSIFSSHRLFCESNTRIFSNNQIISG